MLINRLGTIRRQSHLLQPSSATFHRRVQTTKPSQPSTRREVSSAPLLTSTPLIRHHGNTYFHLRHCLAAVVIAILAIIIKSSSTTHGVCHIITLRFNGDVVFNIIMHNIHQPSTSSFVAQLSHSPLPRESKITCLVVAMCNINLFGIDYRQPTTTKTRKRRNTTNYIQPIKSDTQRAIGWTRRVGTCCFSVGLLEQGDWSKLVLLQSYVHRWR